MTRLLVLSDLHLEHRPAWFLPDALPPFDVAVFAGDVDASPERAVRRLAEAPALTGRPIVFVAGNHEFYDGCIDERLAAGRAACDGRVLMLNRDVATVAGIRFVGATLWTNYRLFGDAAKAMGICRRYLSDHRLIEIGPPGSRRPFRPEDAAERHAGDRAFIEAALAAPFDGPTVVVTHHAPHPGSVAPRWARDPATPGSVSDLGYVMRRGRPALWIHGHVHDSFDYKVDATRIVANPKGYGPRRAGAPPENSAFAVGRVVELSLAFQLVRWTVLRLRAGGERHILGYRLQSGRGRTTSPIRSFDRATRIATTSSGNRYELVGDPSGDGLDDPVVTRWLASRGLSERDVEVVAVDDL